MINEDKKKLDWKPAMQIFSKVSTWVVVPIIFALIIGKALDARYDTDPWIFLGLIGIAFFISMYGIVRVVVKYIKDIDPPSNKTTADKEKKINNL